MTTDQQNVTPNHESSATPTAPQRDPRDDGAPDQNPEPQPAALDFGSMIRNVSPALRRVVVYQAIILLVLVMVVVGTVAYRGTLALLSGGDETAEESSKTGVVPDTATAEQNRNNPPQKLVGQAGVLNIRPEGAVLIRVDRSNGVMVFHFRANGADFVRIVDEKSGAVEAYDIP